MARMAGQGILKMELVDMDFWTKFSTKFRESKRYERSLDEGDEDDDERETVRKYKYKYEYICYKLSALFHGFILYIVSIFFFLTGRRKQRQRKCESG